jgi:hypothetical protein
MPQGSYWHADLLAQMATAREPERPTVVDEPLRARLEGLSRLSALFPPRLWLHVGMESAALEG